MTRFWVNLTQRLLLMVAIAVLIAAAAEAKVSVSVTPKTGALDAEFKLTATGLKASKTYTVTVTSNADSLKNCAASGSFENGQVLADATAKTDSKGKLKFGLTPKSALGENWCQGSYSGKIKVKGQKSTTAKFSFKAEVGA